MCFLLYIGTTREIDRKEWDETAPDVCVKSLKNDETKIRTHFSKPEVQYMGSTSGCGCDFPHLMFQNGGWPASWEEKGTDQASRDRRNQEALVAVLRATGEESVELYGVWSGDFSEPKSREEISITDLLRPDFYFKEQGFYFVKL